MGGLVSEADADEGFGIGKIDGGEVEGSSSDCARKDSDGFGVVGAEDLDGGSEGGIDRRGRGAGVRGGTGVRGGAGNSACIRGEEEDGFGEMGEDEERESGDRAGSTNKARLGGGGAALTVTER